MNRSEALDIFREYDGRSVLTPDEEFMYIEALEFLIEDTKETAWMVNLGGYYYGKKQYNLALKYYEMADAYGDSWAPEGLGYIWYYGRTGERDYEKAFKYYSKAADNGMVKSMMKVADMYKNGYYVEKSYDKYCEIIEKLYDRVRGTRFPHAKADILTRMARIRKAEGKKDEAVELYLEAKHEVAERLSWDPFFGDLNVMKWLIEDLYTLIEPDPADFDLYDLYQIMKEPIKVAFMYEGEEYTVESFDEEGGITIKFGEKWYRSIDDFFLKGEIDEELLPVLYYDMYAFRVIR